MRTTLARQINWEQAIERYCDIDALQELAKDQIGRQLTEPELKVLYHSLDNQVSHYVNDILIDEIEGAANPPTGEE